MKMDSPPPPPLALSVTRYAAVHFPLTRPCDRIQQAAARRDRRDLGVQPGFQADPGASSRAECHHGHLWFLSRLLPPPLCIVLVMRHTWSGGDFLVLFVRLYRLLALSGWPLSYFFMPLFPLLPLPEFSSESLPPRFSPL